jgi:hypothetical protein
MKVRFPGGWTAEACRKVPPFPPTSTQINSKFGQGSLRAFSLNKVWVPGRSQENPLFSPQVTARRQDFRGQFRVEGCLQRRKPPIKMILFETKS